MMATMMMITTPRAWRMFQFSYDNDNHSTSVEDASIYFLMVMIIVVVLLLTTMMTTMMMAMMFFFFSTPRSWRMLKASRVP